jgi:hypothetical protein
MIIVIQNGRRQHKTCAFIPEDMEGGYERTTISISCKENESSSL